MWFFHYFRSQKFRRARFQFWLTLKLAWYARKKLTVVVLMPKFGMGYYELFRLDSNELCDIRKIESPTLVSIWDAENFCKDQGLMLIGKIISPWLGGEYGTIKQNIVAYK